MRLQIQENRQFDFTRLADYLLPQIPGLRGHLVISQFDGGQSNPTFGIVSESHRLVLRCKPPGLLLRSAHAIDREFRVITALQGCAVPVPRTWCLCEDRSIIGTEFYVMDWVDGRILREPSLPTVEPWERAATFDEMNRVIAALHSIPYESVGLTDYGKPGNYFARQINRWIQQYRASSTERIDVFERLIDWLPRNIPAGDEISIVHGDYRLDNLVLHPSEPRVLAVLDWELSTLGHPLADFAYHCMIWQIPKDLFRGLGGMDLDALGIPSQSEYIAAYCRRTGRTAIDPEHWNFYIAYNLFRLAAIMQGIAGRVRHGTAVSAQAHDVARSSRPIAELAWEQIRSSLMHH
jgi:aminoglycoside phosphotransferase (APT) family kinase protein